MKKTTAILAVLCALVFASGCATVGRDFPVAKVPSITIGKTTQNDIYAMFGHPWRTGIEDGSITWTYGKYCYSLFKETSTTDLVIRFDSKNVVSSFSYNTTEQ
jgi:hypothetical protein